MIKNYQFAKMTKVAIVGLIVVGSALSSVSSVALSPAAGDEDLLSRVAEASDPGPETTIVTQRFDHALSLPDAIALVERDDVSLKGFRIENDQVVSEYWPDPTFPPEKYLDWFRDLYGTEPEVVGVIIPTAARPIAVETPPEENGSSPTLPPQDLTVPIELPPTYETELPEFVAEAPGEGAAWEMFDESSTDPASSLTEPSVELASSDQVTVDTASASIQTVGNVGGRQRWFPDAMEYRIERWDGRQYFYTFANWGNGSTARARPQTTYYTQGRQWVLDYAMEFEVNLRNSLASGQRPFCEGGYREKFIAVNEGYSWGVSLGRDSYANQLGAYADTNDYADECGKQSMAIGLSQPWNMPRNAAGKEQILISINARPGVRESSKISATVQLVDNHSCQNAPWMSLTDCMGFTQIPPQDADPGRLGLREDRNWTASPNKCWLSMNHGLSGAPTLSTPGWPYNGCYQG